LSLGILQSTARESRWKKKKKKKKKKRAVVSKVI